MKFKNVSHINNVSTTHDEEKLPQPPHTPGAYIHIGKAGGSTMTRALRNGCHSWVKKPCGNLPEEETLISRWTTYYHVPDFGKQTLRTIPYQFYVIHLRDPLTRFRSIFGAYHLGNIDFRDAKDKYSNNGKEGRQRQRLFSKCFPSLETFATAVAKELDNATIVTKEEFGNLTSIITANTIEESCRGVATKILREDVMFNEHWYWNHHSVYRRALLPNRNFVNATVLALRTEKLWGDWIVANQYLGQSRVAIPSNTTKRRAYGDLKLPVPSTLSDEGRKHLCWALLPDYYAYLAMLWRAANVNVTQKEESLKICQTSCPWLDLSFDGIGDNPHDDL